MSKRYSIRWNESDAQALSRAVKNFNAKIARLEKKDPSIKTALPERVSVKQLRELIDTRQDLNRELNALQRFTRRGAEEIVSIPDNDYSLKLTKWQREEMNRRIGVINRKRALRLKAVQAIEMQSGGEDLGYTVGQFGMGKAEEVSLTPLKAFTPKMSRADALKKFKHIVKESQSGFFDRKDETLRENYITGIRRNYRPEDADELEEAIRDLSFNEFYKRWRADPGAMEWASKTPTETEYLGYVNHLRSTWRLPIRK